MANGLDRKNFDGYYYKVDTHGYVYADDAPGDAGSTTDPYGSLTFAIGSEDDFVCFDYLVLEAHVALHATVNSETGGFIQDFDYAVARYDDAYNVAVGMVDAANDWLFTNGVECDEDSAHGASFPDRVQSSIMFRTYDQDAPGIDY